MFKNYQTTVVEKKTTKVSIVNCPMYIRFSNDRRIKQAKKKPGSSDFFLRGTNRIGKFVPLECPIPPICANIYSQIELRAFD